MSIAAAKAASSDETISAAEVTLGHGDAAGEDRSNVNSTSHFEYEATVAANTEHPVYQSDAMPAFVTSSAPNQPMIPRASSSLNSATGKKRPNFPMLIGVGILVVALLGGGSWLFASGILDKSEKVASPSASPSASLESVPQQSVDTSSPPVPIEDSATVPADYYPTEPSLTEPEVPIATPEVPAQVETGFTCWDGSQVAGIGECKAPSEINSIYSYLRYVFPSIGDGDCFKKEYAKRTKRSVGWECNSASGGVLRYRYYQSSKDSAAHYKAKFKPALVKTTYEVYVNGEKIPAVAKTLKKKYGDDGYVVTLMWNDGKHSITAGGSTWEIVWETLAQANVRPQVQMRGYDNTSGSQQYPIVLR